MSDDAAAPSTRELTTVASFTAAGASVAGPYAAIGAVIGAVVGLGFVIGSRYLKKDPYEDYVAPEPERRRNPNADEGNPCPVAYGSFVRCPGQVIWMSKIAPDPVTQTVPGKGKAAQDIVVEHRYVCNIAVAWCRNFAVGVKRIYANGEIIHDLSLSTDNTFNVSSVFANSEFNGSSTNEKEHFYVTYTIPIAQWDSSDKGWKVGLYFVITAGAGGIAANTGRMWIKSIRTTASSKIIKFHKCVETSHQDGSSSGCSQGGGASQAAPGPYTYIFTGNGSSTSSNDVSNKMYMDDVDHHLGRRFPQGQLPEQGFEMPHFMSGKPSEIGYTGTVYSEIFRFNVTKWGSTIPRLEALVEVHDGPEQTDRVLRRLIERGDSLKGIGVDLTQVTGEVRGYMVLGPTTTLSAVQEFMSFYALEAHEGYALSEDVLIPQLIFTPRDAAVTFFPTIFEIGAHEYGSEGIRDQEIIVDDGRGTPNHLILAFIDADKDFQAGSAEYINVGAGNVTPRTTKMHTDLTLTSGEARGHAKTFLQLMQQNRDNFKATLPPDWLFLRPGDRVFWPSTQLSDDPTVRLTQVTRGQNSVLEIEGTIDDELVYTQFDDDDVIPPAAPDIPSGPFVIAYIYDIPPLSLSDAKTFGLYVGALVLPGVADQEDTTYRDREDNPDTSVVLWRSSNDGDTYVVLGSQDKIGLSGILVDNTLGDGVDYVWDSANTIIVTLEHRSMLLESASREDVASGRANIALVGAEIIGFTTVVSLGDDQYELSDLLRGLRDTSHLMATHKDNETFVSLIGDNLRFAELPIGDYRRPQIIKAIPRAASVADEADFDPNTEVPEAETLRPFTVRSRWVRRYVDLSYRVYFKRRTRVPFRLLSGLPTPRCETQNCYKMDVFWFDPGAGFERTFIRTLCCCFGEDDEYFIDYTKSEQVVDFFDSGRILTGILPDLLEFELYQCSDTVGEGRRNIICARGGGAFIQYDMCPPAS